jgi:hypothetical protein
VVKGPEVYLRPALFHKAVKGLCSYQVFRVNRGELEVCGASYKKPTLPRGSQLRSGRFVPLATPRVVSWQTDAVVREC